jgi:hypothetical protein
MPLIRRRRKPFSLENMAQMPSTVATHNLRALNAKRPVDMARHSARNRIKVGRPAASRLEFGVCLVYRRVAGSTVVDAR